MAYESTAEELFNVPVEFLGTVTGIDDVHTAALPAISLDAA